jgi:phage repressor protein C with HTH and peptisase S24 domain
MNGEVERNAVGERVRSERMRRGYSQGALSALLKIKQAMMSRVELGGSYHPSLLREIATILQVNEEWLRTGKGAKEFYAEPTPAGIVREVSPAPPVAGMREVPVVSWAAAGAAKDYHDLAGFLDEKVVTDCKDANAFAVIVDGDSMEPKISVGDRVIVSPNKEAQSGDIVIARTRKDHGVYLKKFLRHGPRGEKVRLVSFNPDYPPLEFELKDFRFIYPIVGLFRKF